MPASPFQLIAAAAVTAVLVPGAGASVRYVDDDAAAAGDGLSWATAYRFLQDALAEAAMPASGVTEIRVAGGTYVPDADEGAPAGTGDRFATFALESGVALAGGWAGPGEPDPDVRDIAAFESVLSGDLLGDDQPGFVNIQENSIHLVTASGTDATAVLDGFTVRSGNAEATGVDRNGGGVYNVGGSAVFVDCTFADNWAELNGGAMYNTGGGVPTMLRCTFAGNLADGGSGGAVANSGSAPVIRECDFSGNTANVNGGAVDNSAASPVIAWCTFTDNFVVIFNGGAINNRSGASPLIAACTFAGNEVGHNGGAITNRFESNPVIAGCLFTGNIAEDWGGAIRDGVTSGSRIVNCTFTGNLALQRGGAVSAGGDVRPPASHTVIWNSILWGDTAADGPELALNEGAVRTVTVGYCDVEGGEGGVDVAAGMTLVWAGGNMNADPQFAAAASEQLAAGSPCIDAGHDWWVGFDEADLDDDGDTDELVPVDLDGLPRYADAASVSDTGCGLPVVADLGAYEYQGAPADKVFADTNGDGIVGVDDFLDVLAGWGVCGDSCCIADLDLDGLVGVGDFLILLASWTF